MIEHLLEDAPPWVQHLPCRPRRQPTVMGFCINSSSSSQEPVGVCSQRCRPCRTPWYSVEKSAGKFVAQLQWRVCLSKHLAAYEHCWCSWDSLRCLKTSRQSRRHAALHGDDCAFAAMVVQHMSMLTGSTKKPISIPQTVSSKRSSNKTWTDNPLQW